MTVPPLLPPTLKIGRDAHVAIGYTFEDNPHHYLPDAVGTLVDGKSFQTSVSNQESIPRSTLGRLVRRTRQLGQIACVPHGSYRGVTQLHPAFAECIRRLFLLPLLVADPGAGKTMSIRDLQKRAGGRSVLAVVAPKNNDDEQALGDQFVAALGLPIRGHWSTRKPKLMGHLHQYGTQCLIVDSVALLVTPPKKSVTSSLPWSRSTSSWVECPHCGRMRSLSPVKGVLRFKPHTRRKQQTPLTEKRWSSSGKTDWYVVGGE